MFAACAFMNISKQSFSTLLKYLSSNMIQKTSENKIKNMLRISNGGSMARLDILASGSLYNFQSVLENNIFASLENSDKAFLIVSRTLFPV